MSSTAIKATGGVLGGAAVVGISTKIGLDLSNSSPKRPGSFTLLYKSTSFGTSGNYTKNTFGYAFGRYMVDKSDTNWWNYSEHALNSNKEELSNDFQAVRGNSETRAYLSAKCEAVYKKTKANVTGDEERDVWRYCSPLGKKPKVISAVDGAYSGKWGGQTDIKDAMLADDDENIGVWEHVFHHVWEGVQKDSLDTNIFRNLDSVSKLRTACSNAYSSTVDTNKNWYGVDVGKFCALDYSKMPTDNNTDNFKYPTMPSN